MPPVPALGAGVRQGRCRNDFHRSRTLPNGVRLLGVPVRHVQSVNQLLRMTADIVLNSTFPQAELQRELDVIRQEAIDYADDPARGVKSSSTGNDEEPKYSTSKCEEDANSNNPICRGHAIGSTLVQWTSR